MLLTHVRLRAPFVILPSLILLVSRWLASSHPGWDWRDYLALALTYIAAAQMASFLAPLAYLRLLRRPLQNWSEEEQAYALEMCGGSRRFIRHAISFGLAYGFVFSSMD